MKFGEIDFTQASTIRGAVWVTGGIVATVFLALGHDSTQVMAITAAVAGGMGVAIKD
ncbi:MAG: hypothetical protein WC465_04830 [Patescibacteria group bacterium]